MSRLQNKVAVITGGTSGIGLATAERFVAEGAFVYIFARGQDELDKTVASIGRNIVGVQGDVRTPQQIMSSCCVRIPSFPLDLNDGTVVFRSAGKNHEVATRDLILAAHQLTDWSDCINDGCPGRVGHEALQWF